MKVHVRYSLLFSIIALCARPVLSEVPPVSPSGLLVHDGDTVVFLGDSITARGAAPGGYVKLVAAGLEALGVHIKDIGAGVSGNTSKDMLARFDVSVLQKKPTWMTLSCGVNDVWHHGTSGVELDAYEQNITSMVDQAQASGIKVFILTATVIGETDNGNNQKLAAYNDFLRGLAKKKHCPLADLNAMFQAALKATPPAEGTRLLTVDGVHMNPNGNMLMAEGVLKGFGMSDSDFSKVREVWADIPGLFHFGVALISPSLDITLRQNEALGKIAAGNKTTIQGLANAWYCEVLRDVLTAHKGDKDQNIEQIQSEATKRFHDKLFAAVQ